LAGLQICYFTLALLGTDQHSDSLDQTTLDIIHYSYNRPPRIRVLHAYGHLGHMVSALTHTMGVSYFVQEELAVLGGLPGQHNLA
jgi:hypothetical protein